MATDKYRCVGVDANQHPYLSVANWLRVSLRDSVATSDEISYGISVVNIATFLATELSLRVGDGC
ncbi:predicted protein [Arabidopsis lyrata subsp. lyrata]|uniref:Predicted protein n=1 Tax=Arabidopsis lyrata subsp. lyrata TaxID=81972 RepID=D7LNB0_ARALL|nr:predicted protein [Arabidopsis lyrata subsp. lyrata]